MDILIKNISKKFGETVVLDQLNLEFPKGKLTTLLGPSGCGKSTLLNIISGILPPSEGNIFFGDKDVTALDPAVRNVGLVFQNYALYPHMTVRENIAFPLELKRIKKRERYAKAEELAELMRLTDLLDRRPSQLSGGQQQRVAIARALAKNPSILLLDEPLSNLDARLRLEMREEIRRIQQKTKITTVFVTHDQEEALSISDHVVLLKKGYLQQQAAPHVMYSDPENMFVADFLGNPPINLTEATVAANGLCLQDGTEIHANVPEALHVGQKVKIGIRSEMFQNAEDAAPDTWGVCNNVFISGKDTLYHVSLGDWEVRASLMGDCLYQIGDRIPLRIREKGIYFFDYESEMRIR